MTDVPDQPAAGWWAVVELTDHRKITGLLSEQVVAGTSFLRIDVPAATGRQRSTQLYAPHAVYSITPVDDPVALRAAEHPRQSFPETVVKPANDPAPPRETARQTRADLELDLAPGSGSRHDEERELLTVSELASRYTCSRSTVMRWQTFDDFPEPAVRGPRRLAVYELADVERFLTQHPELLRTYHRG